MPNKILNTMFTFNGLVHGGPQAWEMQTLKSPSFGIFEVTFLFQIFKTCHAHKVHWHIFFLPYMTTKNNYHPLTKE
jgi:hypothetical protein